MWGRICFCFKDCSMVMKVYNYREKQYFCLFILLLYMNFNVGLFV